MFKITQGKGFHITFANGWTVSAQWGIGNYTSDRGMGIPTDENQRAQGEEGRELVEIAAWKIAEGDENTDLNWGNDTVVGWVSSDAVAHVMSALADGDVERAINAVRRTK